MRSWFEFAKHESLSFWFDVENIVTAEAFKTARQPDTREFSVTDEFPHCGAGQFQSLTNFAKGKDFRYEGRRGRFWFHNEQGSRIDFRGLTDGTLSGERMR
jgi:hypothetical protein